MKDRCDVCGSYGDDPRRVLVHFHDERFGTVNRTWQTLCSSHRAGLALLAEQTSLLSVYVE